MASIKPSVPKGTRDFSPAEMVRRNYIFDTIRSVFKKFGYQEIQTPTMENLDTLTGKYGDEGDKLIFKIINSGAFLTCGRCFHCTTIRLDLKWYGENTNHKVNLSIAHDQMQGIFPYLS